jgi:uncharacterized protein involved in outer membrane biogenesis
MTQGPVKTEPARARSWLRRLLILALVLALLVGLYAWAGFWLLPRVVTSKVTAYVREHYGRELTLRELRFNPFKLQLQVGEMALPDAGGGPMLAWQSLFVDIDGPRSLFSRALAFQSIRLSGPRIDLVHRADGRWNVLDLVPPATNPTATPDDSPPRLIIAAFELTQGAGSITERGGGANRTGQIDDINFSLSDFNTLLSGNHFDLRATAPDIRAIRLEGTLSIQPLVSSGRFEINAANLPKLQNNWMPTLRPVIANGAASFAGEYQLALPDGPMEFKTNIGKLQFENLALRTTPDADDGITIPTLSVTELALNLALRELSINAITIDQPAITAVLDAGHLNLLDYQPHDTAASDATQDEAATDAWKVTVNNIALNQATMDFTDRLEDVRRPLQWQISALQASVGPLALPTTQPLPLRAMATVDKDGKLSIEGNYDLNSGIASLDVDAANLDLPKLQPILAQQTQVTLREGKASVKGKLITGGKEELRYTGTTIIDGLRVADRINGTD